jgi:antitoxin HigA-1
MAEITVMAPVHPGEILLEEFLKPLGVSQYQLAKQIGVPARRINEIVHGQRRVSADTALRLARFFGTSERFWINLQSRYDLEVDPVTGKERRLKRTVATEERAARELARLTAI